MFVQKQAFITLTNWAHNDRAINWTGNKEVPINSQLDWENWVSKIFTTYYISEFKCRPKTSIQTFYFFYLAGCAVKCGPQNWPIIVHVLVEIYNICVYCTLIHQKPINFALVNPLLTGSNRLHLLLFTCHK